MLIDMEKIFKNTAVFNGKVFNHFGIREATANLYGDKVEDIIEVELKISDNQKPLELVGNEPDYWGWYDNTQQKFTMIYAQRFLLDMCFPSGFEINEKRGLGKAYRLEVTKI